MTEQEIIRIKALLDESGNGAFPSDTNIITHNKTPLRDYIEQKIYTVPDGFNFNDKKIVIIENIDITALRKNILNGFTVNCTGLPISGHNGYINTWFYSETAGCIEFINAFGKWNNLFAGGTWQGWKLMTGEVPLWSGNLQTGTIACGYDLSMFGSFKIIATSDVAIPCSVYNNRIFGTAGLPYAEYTNIYYISGMIDGKNFTINRFKVQGLSSSIVLTQGTAAKLIGRP